MAEAAWDSDSDVLAALDEPDANPLTVGQHKCKPWSRRSLEERVASFSVATWFAKPPNLSPLICARYGWHNVDVDLLGCHVCGKKHSFAPLEPNLSPTLEPNAEAGTEGGAEAGTEAGTDADTDSVASARAQFLEMARPPPLSDEEVLKILDDHDPMCPWQGNPSPRSLIEPQSLTKAQWSRSVQSLLETLHAHDPPLDAPLVDTPLVGEVEKAYPGVIESILKEVVHFNPSLRDAFPIDKLHPVALIPISNWSLPNPKHIDAASPLTLRCSLCQRSLLLDQFPPVSKEAADDSTWSFLGDDEEAERPWKRPRKLQPFDPIAEHRVFCPFAKSETVLQLVKSALSPSILNALNEKKKELGDSNEGGREGRSITELEATLARIRKALRPDDY